MSVREHREKLLEAMADNSIAVLYAGRPTLANEDEYLPFAVNSLFFYCTDYSRAGMILILTKLDGKKNAVMFIEETDAFTERWTGKMPAADEVKERAQIDSVRYLSEFKGYLASVMASKNPETVYFDTYRYDLADLPTYNAQMAADFQKLYPAAVIRDIHPLSVPLREVKDAEEIERIRKAAGHTAAGLKAVLERLKPGMTEYQAQAIFEGVCRYRGAGALAFPTISAGGANACSMHYDSNRDTLENGTLLLLDLGAKAGNYCSDVTRTYPVNGRFSPRQRELYELVLKANKAVAGAAAPGVTRADLEKLTCSILGEGLVKLGLLENAGDVRKYYMHSVCHSIGIDSHDAERRDVPLQPGWVISDEPGLYVDEEGIGIRIEDDLLITENGCEVLTAAIPKEPDEIECLMAEAGGRNED